MKSMYQRKRGLLRAAAIVQVLTMAGAGCKSSTPKQEPGINDVSISQALVGKDSSLTVTAANTVVNGYAALEVDAIKGATSIEVSDLRDFTAGTPARPALAAGDVVLIIQMAGATINETDNAQYGNVTDLNSAGRYEFIGVTGVDSTANTISLGCGLKNDYTADDKTQVVRVPQYTNLIINDGASLTADAWNGTVGGVVAVHAMNTITVTGSVDVSGKGYRGGTAHRGTENGSNTTDAVTFISADENLGGGMKGEGIAGWPGDFATPYGRGAPANAGGGGNWHNAGGGGGANASADDSADDNWTGQGAMLSTVEGGEAAWRAEVGASPNPLANSPGGGRGGYTYSSDDENPLILSPGDPSWGGGQRRDRGGLGGHPLTSSAGGAEARLFMGGGGGAGDGNDSDDGSDPGRAGSGGPGGGIAFLIAGTVTGGGTINADGAKGGDSSSGDSGSNSDGAGGGGGGGTILVHAGLLSGVKLYARGGLGGNQVLTLTGADNFETEGPGGGGGGGFIAYSGGTPEEVLVAGREGGTTNSEAVDEFPSNGATAGNTGVIVANKKALMYCTDSVTPKAIIMDPEPSNPSRSPVTFYFGAGEANNGVDAGDSSAVFECKLDEEDWHDCPPTYTVSFSGEEDEGDHTIQVRVKDLSGNGPGAVDSHTWRVDLTAPKPKIVSGPGGSTSGGTTTSTTANFTLDTVETETTDSGVDEDITYWCRLDNNPDDPKEFVLCDETDSSNPTFPDLGVGTHTLEVRARDEAGNETAVGDTVTWTWTVHGLDAGAGDDSGEDDAGDAGEADASAIDALILADAADTDAEIDTAGVVVLDASSDRARDTLAADAGQTRRDTARARDTSVSFGDVAGDGAGDGAGEAGGGVMDAASDASDATPGDGAASNDAGKLDVSLRRDTAVAPSPDAYVPPADAAVNPSGKQDASAAPSGIKIMGGGFCSMNPSGSAPGLATLFLVAAFGLMIVRRRRR